MNEEGRQWQTCSFALTIWQCTGGLHHNSKEVLPPRSGVTLRPPLPGLRLVWLTSIHHFHTLWNYVRVAISRNENESPTMPIMWSLSNYISCIYGILHFERGILTTVIIIISIFNYALVFLQIQIVRLIPSWCLNFPKP